MFLSVCQSVGLSQPWALQKQLNRSRCRLGCGIGWTKNVLDEGPDHHMRRINFVEKKLAYLHGKWLAERARSTILQQQLPSFRETLDQVHFSCRRLMLKSDKIWCTYLVINYARLRTVWTPVVRLYSRTSTNCSGMWSVSALIATNSTLSTRLLTPGMQQLTCQSQWMTLPTSFVTDVIMSWLLH